MLLVILLLSLTDAEPADAKSSPNLGLEDGLGNLVEKLESRLRDLETKMQVDKEKEAKEKKELESRLEAKDEEMKTRLQELEERMKEEINKLEIKVEGESFKKEIASNIANPSPRDLPIVLISAWQPYYLESPQTVTFNSFLANYNNANRPGGGDAVLDLDSGVFTCSTPGYYTSLSHSLPMVEHFPHQATKNLPCTRMVRSFFLKVDGSLRETLAPSVKT